MSITSSEYVGRVLECLRDGLAPVVLAKYRERYPYLQATAADGTTITDYVTRIRKALASDRNVLPYRALHSEADLIQQLDAYSWLVLMGRRDMKGAFDAELTWFHQGCIRELRDYRNRWLRQSAISYDDALRAADSAERLLRRLGAWEQAEAAAELREQIKRIDLERAMDDDPEEGATLTLPALEMETELLTLPTGCWLEMTPPDQAPVRAPLSKQRVVLGRSTANVDILVPDRRVSRIHLQILHFAEDGFSITDLQSANGTLINGERILPNVPVQWPVGEVITIGDTALTLAPVTPQLTSGAA